MGLTSGSRRALDFITSPMGFFVLEACVEELAQDIKRLHRRRRTFSYGSPITIETLPPIASEIGERVRELHHIEDFVPVTFALTPEGRQKRGGVSALQPKPPFHFEDGYISGANIIEIDEDHTVATVVSSIAHEYTHALQAKFMPLSETMDHSPIIEGHARLVERLVSLDYVVREDNLAYIYDTFNSLANEVYDGYKIACKRLGRSPSRNIDSRHLLDIPAFTGQNYVKHYSIGSAAITVAETMYGAEILLPALIRNDFSFLTS